MSQPTSTRTFKPVSAGLAKHMGRIFEDASLNYPGGLAKMNLVKGDPRLVAKFHEFCDIIVSERAKVVAIRDRPVWKVARIGTHKSNAELRTELRHSDYEIDDFGEDILKNTPVAAKRSELPLMSVSGFDLGLKGLPSRQEIYEAAIATGFLALCPAEVGPQLRLQYPDQPNREWCVVAMEPILDSNGCSRVFLVMHDDRNLCLSSSSGNPGDRWDNYVRWVFVRK